jgi:zinc protease
VYDAVVIRRRLALLGLGALSFSCFATTGEPQVSHSFPVRTYTMPSGLRVIVEQDDGAKLVGMAWVIDAGFADDPPGQPGLAHLVEHLLYTTPDATGVSTWRRLIELGANENAKTETDLTTAFAFAPRAALEELVEIFLDRVADPAHGIDEALLEKERRVVAEELAFRGGADDVGRRLAVNGLARRPLDPEPADMREALRAISLADVRAFIAAHYLPERMTLVLSGPMAPDWDRWFLQSLPANLAGAPDARRPPARHPLAPPSGAPAGAEIVPALGDVRERQLWLAWTAAPARGKDEVPLRLVAALADRLLGRKIETSAISDVSAGSVKVFSSAALRLLLFRLDLRPGADPEHVRGEARDVLETLRVLPIADWLRQDRRRSELDLQIARLAEAFAMESLTSRTLGRARISHDHPEQGVSDVVAAVIDSSLGDLATLISRELSGPPARSILVSPRPDGQLGLGRSVRPAATPETDVEDERVDDEPVSPHDARAIVATAQGLGAHAAAVSRLSNGLTLVVLPRPGLPVATMLLGFHADPGAGERAGLRPALSIARFFRLARGPLDRAILQRNTLEADEYFDTLEMFSSSVKSAIDLLWDEASKWQIEWPSPAGEAWLQRAALREASADGHLSRSAFTTLFGAHPYAFDARSASVRAASANDLRDWIKQVRRPANGVLVVVGDVDAAALAVEAEDALSDWSDDTAPRPAPPAPPRIAAGRPLPLLTAVDPSREWTKLQFGCFLPPAAAARADVVGELLEDALEDELFRRLRVERAATYTPRLSREVLRGGTHVLTGVLDVGPKSGAVASDLLREWLDPTGRLAFDDAVIEKARWRAARRSGLRDETNGAIAHRLYRAWNMGWPLESLDDYPQDLASITPAEVAAALASCRASAVISVLAPQ